VNIDIDDDEGSVSTRSEYTLELEYFAERPAMLKLALLDAIASGKALPPVNSNFFINNPEMYTFMEAKLRHAVYRHGFGIIVNGQFKILRMNRHNRLAINLNKFNRENRGLNLRPLYIYVSASSYNAAEYTDEDLSVLMDQQEKIYGRMKDAYVKKYKRPFIHQVNYDLKRLNHEVENTALFSSEERARTINLAIPLRWKQLHKIILILKRRMKDGIINKIPHNNLAFALRPYVDDAIPRYCLQDHKKLQELKRLNVDFLTNRENIAFNTTFKSEDDYVQEAISEHKKWKAVPEIEYDESYDPEQEAQLLYEEYERSNQIVRDLGG